MAVTKGFGPDAVLAALAEGLDHVGENYAQELLAKASELSGAPEGEPTVRWQFLGAIQRNKVKALAPFVDCWQSVARPQEGTAIAARRPGAAVMVEVDVTGAPGRNGCPPAEVGALVASLLADGLSVRGLMVVAPVDPTAAVSAFRTVRALADDLGLAERSMGMTDDLEAAVREGSTMVRVGRALFGDRPPKPARPVAG